jgi:hypothetical protein
VQLANGDLFFLIICLGGSDSVGASRIAVEFLSVISAKLNQAGVMGTAPDPN